MLVSTSAFRRAYQIQRILRTPITVPGKLHPFLAAVASQVLVLLLKHIEPEQYIGAPTVSGGSHTVTLYMITP